MNYKVTQLLRNGESNHIFPFLWLHGEEEAVIRDYMRAIDEGNMKAVCVESRPHPDFCGSKWWEDMDVILDEAKKRNMKVWILDDSHFPTGFANGAMADQPDERCRQSICCRVYDCSGLEELKICREDILHPKAFQPTQVEMYIGEKNPRIFNDDKLLSLIAINMDVDDKGKGETSHIDLIPFLKEDSLRWRIPEGNWKVYALHLSRNMGYHRSYINMMDQESCKVLLDAVYEPHYEHYKVDFGNTIAGFFSDEPELGNGHMYEKGIAFGTDKDYPWSGELEECLKNSLGQDYAAKLVLLWEEDAPKKEKAKVRFAFMDAVTRLVEKNFSSQIGEWCRSHGVEYIGHLIEDDNQHARTGCSLGHFYRGLAGQDMSGIDDIGGQVYPQGEDFSNISFIGNVKDGEFYHYSLGKLGASHGAIDPLKKGRTMCEIFGNYGWEEGIQLEKYLADHFMVRGINYFVPHAFSLKNYPDPDCPPHFYAGGNDPQYSYFGHLMKYMNRVCELISDGYHVAPAAILYHGEAEWTGNHMLMQKPARKLADRQIDYDIIPVDVFLEKDRYKTNLDNGLKVNTQTYKVLVIPYAEFISASLADSIEKLQNQGFPVVFLESLPIGIYDDDDKYLEKIKDCLVVKLDNLAKFMDNLAIPEICLEPENNRIRYLHYNNGSDIFYLVNEAAVPYKGVITLPLQSSCYAYNAWDNRLEHVKAVHMENMTKIEVTLYPRKSMIIVFDDAEEKLLNEPVDTYGSPLEFKKDWTRSICKSNAYPNFKDEKIVELPDKLAEELPEFSGFVQYKNSFPAQGREKIVLEITNAAEGVEVLINGRSTGLQIVPPYVYDITGYIKAGENAITIEVATSLERENIKLDSTGKTNQKVIGSSGITGYVKLYHQGEVLHSEG